MNPLATCIYNVSCSPMAVQTAFIMILHSWVNFFTSFKQLLVPSKVFWFQWEFLWCSFFYFFRHLSDTILYMNQCLGRKVFSFLLFIFEQPIIDYLLCGRVYFKFHLVTCYCVPCLLANKWRPHGALFLCHKWILLPRGNCSCNVYGENVSFCFELIFESLESG